MLESVQKRETKVATGVRNLSYENRWRSNTEWTKRYALQSPCAPSGVKVSFYLHISVTLHCAVQQRPKHIIRQKKENNKLLFQVLVYGCARGWGGRGGAGTAHYMTRQSELNYNGVWNSVGTRIVSGGFKTDQLSRRRFSTNGMDCAAWSRCHDSAQKSQKQCTLARRRLQDL